MATTKKNLLLKTLKAKKVTRLIQTGKKKVIFVKTPLFKMSGAGNTFVVVDFLQKKFPLKNRKDFVTKICSKTTGVGADGLFFLEPHADCDFQWDFYNSDGSSAEACGNASRCAAQYFFDYYKKPVISFMTLKGAVRVEVKNKIIFVHMPSAEIKSYSPLFIVDTGVPHMVLPTEEIQNHEHLHSLAKANRFPEILPSSGCNVTFVQVLENKIKAVSFERGVEDFTMACGTGAVAAAIYVREKNNFLGDKPIEIQMPGGSMQVDVTQGLKAPVLIGDAQYLCEFYYLREDL